MRGWKPPSVRLAVASSISSSAGQTRLRWQPRGWTPPADQKTGVGAAPPAALAAEWLTAALDQNTGMWAASPFGAGMEVVAIDWLKQLFALPASWGGVLVTGGTMANYVGLAAARRWWALQHDVDIDEDGWTGLPCLPVFGS